MDAAKTEAKKKIILVTAAVKVKAKDLTFTGMWHFHAATKAEEAGYADDEYVEGFVTSENEFISRDDVDRAWNEGGAEIDDQRGWKRASK